MWEFGEFRGEPGEVGRIGNDAVPSDKNMGIGEGYSRDGRVKSATIEDKRAAVHMEMKRMTRLPPNSMYAANCLSVLNKLLQPMSIREHRLKMTTQSYCLPAYSYDHHHNRVQFSWYTYDSVCWLIILPFWAQPCVHLVMLFYGTEIEMSLALGRGCRGFLLQT
ncbi:hypothetical protein MLD38_000652 [Melastoma candidum]|uniref:Uncharacterized protein n=1 Tax=Melastoma candidum TaxID=119954 RepID=A0ACB9SBM6_9MYRT|nr:hypothetical protein MLD38_000652 [Melastoma candidum]